MSELIISIDIGKKNLGFTTAKSKNGFKSLDEIDFDFGLFNIDELLTTSESVVPQRARILASWLHGLIADSSLKAVVIEEQVNSNTIAMAIMYCLCGILTNFTTTIAIFPPKLKFTKIKQPYSSTSKKHKRLSVENASIIASHLSPSSSSNLLEGLSSRSKKDDIADSFNQLIIWLIDNHILSLSFENLRNWLNLNSPSSIEPIHLL